MIPEAAHFCLILAFGLAVLLATLPFYGAVRGNDVLMRSARSLAMGQWVFVLLAFIGLAYAFMTDDFSVSLVANHSNSKLPIYFKFSAVWGQHEGSLVLWTLVLACWTLAVAIFSRSMPDDVVARVLSVMGMISVGFLAFSLFTSNPFERSFPNIPLEGSDLNPLLQDIGLIIHPPVLYVGYVGFSVAFAFAIAALSAGRLDAAWARWSRPWTNIAWAFLTVGIGLGSWWAYYELGWGGWWFWDPVENASFMPWLVGTALIHSLAVTEKRGVFKSWTVLLAIFAFSLSLLGTFLVRSGVLTSVHSFASDPTRGLFVLCFLGIVVGGSLTLYALRVPTVQSRAGFGYLSRELFLLCNNVVFLLALLTVLLGTLFPLVMDALGQGKYSVGPPYFNALFVPMMALLLALMGLGPASRWKSTTPRDLFKPLAAAAIASIVLGIVLPFLYVGQLSIATVLTVMLAAWVVLTSLLQLRNIITANQTRAVQWRRLRLAHIGMLLAHVGMAVTVLGVCLTSQFSEEKDMRVAPGDVVTLGSVDVRFNGHSNKQGPNYIAQYGDFTLLKDGKEFATLKPEKRQYLVQKNVMTEAAIDPGLWRDIYIALGEQLDDGAWAVRLHYKPFVRWMWLGALMMALGGVVAVADPRYRVRRVRAPAPATATPPEALQAS